MKHRQTSNIFFLNTSFVYYNYYITNSTTTTIYIHSTRIISVINSEKRPALFVPKHKNIINIKDKCIFLS